MKKDRRTQFTSLALAALCISLCACGAKKGEASPSGYEIQTETMYLKTLARGSCQYTFFQTEDRTLEYYASPTETLVLDTQDQRTKYAKQANQGQAPADPTEHLLKDLEALDFHYVEDKDGCAVYRAEKTVTVSDAQQIPYTKYSLAVDWRDGKQYRFSYYTYADGATLISAEAPDAINPRIHQDTQWVLDLDDQRLYNQALNESYPLTVTATQTGQGLSPDGDQSASTQSTHYTYKYVNLKTQRIEWIMYQTGNAVAENETKIHILYETDIQRPEIPNGAEGMTREEQQTALMLITMLGSLF